MLITYLTATACAVAAICLGRSEYEKKALSVEEMNLYSDKVSKDRTFIFLSDLHENTFGPDNEKLIRSISVNCIPQVSFSMSISIYTAPLHLHCIVPE